jgi:pilus assembly protein CpaE
MISIVIISGDIDSSNNMVRHITSLGDQASIEGVASTFESGFEIVHRKRPMVVIMDLSDGNVDTFISNVQQILERFPRVLVFAASDDKSSDTILKVMRAGVAEYILKPVSEVDLTSALQKLGRLWVSKPEPAREEGHMFTVFSPKGGVGVTTVAINLATNIHAITNNPTLLVDLDLNAGDVTTFLNMKPTYTISDVTMNITRLDRSFLKGVIQRHESGINVIAEPQRVEEGVSIAGTEVKKVLSLLKTMFKYTVIDTEPVLNDRTVAAIEMSEMLIIVFVLSLPGIRNMQRYFSYLDKLGVKREKIKLVVNRHLKKGDIKIEEAERVIKHPIFLSIPNEYNIAMASLNKGIPISSYDDKSKLNIGLKELAISMVARKR